MYTTYVAMVVQTVRTQGFSTAEDYIDSLPINDDQKSALWLLAYAEQPEVDRRRTALETLMLVAT